MPLNIDDAQNSPQERMSQPSVSVKAERPQQGPLCMAGGHPEVLNGHVLAQSCPWPRPWGRTTQTWGKKPAGSRDPPVAWCCQSLREGQEEG